MVTPCHPISCLGCQVTRVWTPHLTNPLLPPLSLSLSLPTSQGDAWAMDSHPRVSNNVRRGVSEWSGEFMERVWLVNGCVVRRVWTNIHPGSRLATSWLSDHLAQWLARILHTSVSDHMTYGAHTHDQMCLILSFQLSSDPRSSEACAKTSHKLPHLTTNQHINCTAVHTIPASTFCSMLDSPY